MTNPPDKGKEIKELAMIDEKLTLLRTRLKDVKRMMAMLSFLIGLLAAAVVALLMRVSR